MKAKKLVTLIALLPLTIMASSCSVEEPNPNNQRKFHDQEEKNTLREVVRYGEKVGHPAPSTGNTRVLVVPVEFTDYPADEIGKWYNSEVKDSKAYKHYKDGSTTEAAGTGRGKEAAREDIRKAFFGEASETYWHSLSSYYKESSYGKLNFNGLVTDWFSAFTDLDTMEPVSTKEFKDGGGTAHNLAQFILNYYTDETMKKYREFKNEDGSYMFKSGTEFLKYFDSDSDGYVDIIEMVYSAPYYATYTDAKGDEVAVDNEMFWAYCGSNSANPDTAKPKLSKWAFQSYYTCVEGGTYDNGVWRSWTCEEISNGTAKVDAHTIVHETGHGLGLADYYDYDNKFYPVYRTDMMDHNVGDHNAYSKSVLGWNDPVVVTGPTTVTVNSFTKTGECIIVPYRGYFSDNKNNTNANTLMNEYLTIELYNGSYGVNEADSKSHYAGKYPLCASDTGLKIFHVDSRLGLYDYSSGTGKFVNYVDSIVSTNNNQIVTIGNSNTGSRTVSVTEGKKTTYNYQIEYLSSTPNKTSSVISNDNLFKADDTFGYDTYVDYKFNSGHAFGYKFKIDSISDDSVTITFYQA